MTTTSIKVKTLLSLLFPDGTDCKDSYATVPEWPPDLFAFCAKYIDMVESYTGIITKDSDLYAAFSPAYIDELATISSNWANHSSQNHEIQRMWDVVISNLEEDMPANNSALLIAIHSLLIVSDEACMGLGFSTTEKNWIQDTYNRRNLEQLNNDLESQQHPTCCFLVPSHILCVQPKARTPQVGCNVRSLSHHLALLPPSSSVHVSWYPAESLRETGSIYSEDNFNIVIVPFPYSINARSVSGHRDTRGVGFFSLDMAWINGQEEAVVDHICRLVGEAQKDAGEVNGVVLPELALNSCAYELLVKKMKSTEYKGLQFLISGVERFDGKRNSARTTFFADRSDGERVDWHGVQYKHHRWRLDGSQIATYSFGSRLNQEMKWWEDIDVASRSLDFYVFRDGSCFSTLICEDLARMDPCQPILRSIGPNIVFALLMDGPQLKDRWPGRYAMSLADDPGSSVLSLTSKALMRRSSHMFNTPETIALWRDPYGETIELVTPVNSHALLLNLARSTNEDNTLDGRREKKKSYSWRICGSQPLEDVSYGQ